MKSQVFSCEKEGITSSAVKSFLMALDKDANEFHTVVIYRHNNLVAKASWHPFDGKHVQNIHSSSKSFTSTAIGLLYDAKKLQLDDKVMSYFEEYEFPMANEYLETLTIRNLLTMSVGQEFEAYHSHNDWVTSTLGTTITTEPGTKFFYNSGASYILSAIVTKITGISSLEFLRENLFKPLDFSENYWLVASNDTTDGGGGLHINVDDFAKLGLLYLNKGVYNGKRIISEEWCNLATSLQIETAPAGYTGSENMQGYGFQFWRCTHNGFRASGKFGQVCVVLPDQDMVLAVQSSSTGSQVFLDHIWKHLFPGLYKQPLKENIESNEDLSDYISTLKVNVKEGETDSRLETFLDKKTLNFDVNPYGFETISFNFDETIQITIKQQNDDYSINCGRNKWNLDEDDFSNLCLWERNAHWISYPLDYQKPTTYSYATWLHQNVLWITQRTLNAATLTVWQLEIDGCYVKVMNLTKNLYGSFYDIALGAILDHPCTKLSK